MGADRTRSVLIVEDERIVAKDLQQTLAGMGYDAFGIASSAEEAVARASERCPDVVLMDIRIKGRRDGVETAEILRQRFRVPVVYLTALADDGTIDRAKKTEPYGYLLKPVRPAELRSAIELSLYKHEMEKSPRERGRLMRGRLELALTRAYLDEAERELGQVEARLSAEAEKPGGTGLPSAI